MTTTIPIFGKDRPYDGPEESLQVATNRYLRLSHPNIMAFHPPNGGKRPLTAVSKFGKVKLVPVIAKKMKDAGALAGVSDWIILQPSGGYHGAAIELKAKGGALQDSQIKFLQSIQQKGYFVAVCWNLESFITCINNYLECEGITI